MIRFFLIFFLPLSLTVKIPEETMSTMELITSAGFPAQEINVTTRDGYILTIHRIPFGRNSSPGTIRPTVLLQHGLLASSADWVLNLPNQSLAFLLAEAGCDVFLGNVRGNVYARGHRNDSKEKGRDDKEFWRFSFDEMAEFDLEAMVNGVIDRSGAPYIHYVGYSQGTTMMLARLARDKKFGQKIKKFFALAPVGVVSHSKGPIVAIGRDLLPQIELFMKLLGEEEFLPASVIVQFIAREACGESAITNPLCENLLFAIVGPNTNQLNKTRLAAYLSHTPAGTSTQNIIHWAQMTRLNFSQMYDYGVESLNKLYYGQSTPPVYDYSNIIVPTYLFHSPSDLLSDSEDVQYLLRTIPASSLMKNVELKEFNHIDFIYGLRAAEEIYKSIIEEIKDYESNVIRA